MPTLGEPAPPFTLASSLDREISLDDFRGEADVVLVLYPLDVSPVCSTQLPAYSSRREEFERRGAEVIGVNRDGVTTHKAWAREFGIGLPLLADMTGEAARAYGAYRPEAGTSRRAVFVIDREGVLRFQHVEARPGEFLAVDDVLTALDGLPA